jgi:hypothetical protein
MPLSDVWCSWKSGDCSLASIAPGAAELNCSVHDLTLSSATSMLGFPRWGGWGVVKEGGFRPICLDLIQLLCM